MKWNDVYKILKDRLDNLTIEYYRGEITESYYVWIYGILVKKLTRVEEYKNDLS
jgi:hypothetical protein